MLKWEVLHHYHDLREDDVLNHVPDFQCQPAECWEEPRQNCCLIVWFCNNELFCGGSHLKSWNYNFFRMLDQCQCVPPCRDTWEMTLILACVSIMSKLREDFTIVIIDNRGHHWHNNFELVKAIKAISKIFQSNIFQWQINRFELK